MNMNSLIIVAGSTRARLFRTGHPSDPQAPVELIEVGRVDADADAGPRSEPFARQVAARAASFARDHFCNPVIVSAARAVEGALLRELERALPQAQIRRIPADLSALGPRRLMRALEEREAFAPRLYPVQA